MFYLQEAFWSPIPTTARVVHSRPSIASIAKTPTFRVFFVAGVALICIWCASAPQVDRCAFVGSSPEVHEPRLN